MRVCNMDNCDRKHLARGLCGTHYNQTLANRHPKVTMTCAGCGQQVTKDAGRDKRYANVYCTMTCRSEHQHRETRASRKQVALYTGPSALGRYLGALDTPLPSKRVWVAGQCRMCTRDYLCKYGSTTCGAECQAQWDAEIKRACKSRRRARERAAFVANVYPSRIYARDDYTCLLCGDPLDMGAQVPAPHAPTIDHVIPLARGGTHEPANVQAAHFLCNSIKSDRLDTLAAPHQPTR